MKFENLVSWYASQCNGDWEHSYGIKIDTLDNPGWLLTIDLTDTNLASTRINKTTVNNHENDWLDFEISNKQFIGSCSTKNLDNLVSTFLSLSATN